MRPVGPKHLVFLLLPALGLLVSTGLAESSWGKPPAANRRPKKNQKKKGRDAQVVSTASGKAGAANTPAERNVSSGGGVKEAAVKPHSVFNSTWNGGTGNWSTSTDWTPNTVPNNGGGNTFNVTIDSGGTDTVSLDINSTISTLTVGGTAGSSTLQNK